MSTSFRRLFISVCLFILCGNHQFIYPQNSNIQTYTFKDGLPTQSVYDAAQDSSGRMWFACRKGLMMYDGVEWKFLTEKDGIPMADYRKIKVDEKGRIWAMPILSSRSIVYGNIGNWKTLPVNNLAATIYCDFIFLERSKIGSIGVITQTSIYKYEKKWTKYIDPVFGNSTNHSLRTIDNKDYVSTSKGLYIIEDSTLQQIQLNIPKHLRKDIVAICESNQFNNLNNGFYVIGASWLGFYNYQTTTIIYEGFYFPLFPDYVYYFAEIDKNNTIFFGNDEVAYKYDEHSKNLSKIIDDENSETSKALNIVVDLENNKWITSLRGVKKIKGSPFISSIPIKKFVSEEVTAIEEMNDGSMIFGHNNGLSIVNNNRVKTVNFNKYTSNPGDYTRTLDLINFKNSIFVAASKLGFGRLNTNLQFEWISKDYKFSFSTFAIDRTGNLVVADYNDLHKYYDNNLLHICSLDIPGKLEAAGVREIISLPDSSLLISTNGYGIVNLKGTQRKYFQSFNQSANAIYSIFQKDSSTILIGTLAGLYKVDGDSLKKETLENLSISDPVYFIEAGHNPGSIWFGLDKGVIYWEDGQKRFYDANSGLAGFETNRHAGFLDSKGNFWIGTDHGVSKISSNSVNLPVKKPLVDIVSIEDMFSNVYPASNNVNLNFGNNSITVNYRCLSFIDEKRNKFHIHLENSEGKVIDEYETETTSTRFANLEPGEYKVFLNATNPIGIESDIISSSTIFIDGPLYSKWWFFLAGVVFIFLVGLTFERLNSRKKYYGRLETEVEQKTKELKDADKVKTTAIYENIERERKRIASELHDSFGQLLTASKFKLETFQLNHSFEDPNFNDSIDMLTKAGNEIRNIVNDLRPIEIENYGLSAAIKMLCTEHKNLADLDVDMDISIIDGTLLKHEEILIYRIIQEGFNNIVKHSQATKISLKIVSDQKYLLLEITDNGKGFEIGKDFSPLKDDAGFGIINMQKRAETLGAKLVINSSPNEGTAIQLKVDKNG